MTQIKSFKDYLKELEALKDQQIVEDDENILSDEPVDKSEVKTPTIEKIDEEKPTQGGEWYDRTAFNFNFNSNDPKEQFEELKEKRDIVKQTFTEMLNQYDNSIGYKEPTKKIASGEDVIHPVKLLNTSLADITNVFAKWWNDEFPAMLNKYTLQKAKVTGSKYITGKRGTEKATDADNKLKNHDENGDQVTKESLNFENANIIAEAWFSNKLSNFRDSVKNDNAGGAFKSTSELVNGKGNPYNSGNIIDILKKGKLFHKDDAALKIDINLLKKIRDAYKTQGENIHMRYRNAFMGYMNKAEKAMNLWEHSQSLTTRTIKLNDEAYIRSIASSLQYAFSECQSVASSLNIQLSEYAKTLKAIREQITHQCGILDREANSFKTETKLVKKQELENRVETAKTELGNKINAIKTELETKKAERKVSQKELNRQADETEDAQNEIIRNELKNEFISNCKTALNSIADIEDIQYAANAILNGKKIAYLPDNKLDAAKTLFAINALKQKSQRRFEYLTKNSARKRKTFEAIWEKSLENKKEKDANKILENLIKKDDTTKLSDEERENLEKVKEGLEAKEEKQIANGAAKEFDGEEPKNILDYAMQKAKRNAEK